MHAAPGCAITFLSSTSECLKKNHRAREHRKIYARRAAKSAPGLFLVTKKAEPLRFRFAMLKEIDEAVRVRPYKMPRHLWLLEAIHEKLTRLRQGDAAPGN
jgi:hypothetical protein